MELRVRDNMIPRSKIIFIEDQQDFWGNTCLNTIIESKHSRFPVIADDADDRDVISWAFCTQRFIKIFYVKMP